MCAAVVKSSLPNPCALITMAFRCVSERAVNLPTTQAQLPLPSPLPVKPQPVEALLQQTQPPPPPLEQLLRQPMLFAIPMAAPIAVPTPNVPAHLPAHPLKLQALKVASLHRELYVAQRKYSGLVTAARCPLEVANWFLKEANFNLRKQGVEIPTPLRNGRQELLPIVPAIVHVDKSHAGLKRRREL
jgi:hypothetical protein